VDADSVSFVVPTGCTGVGLNGTSLKSDYFFNDTHHVGICRCRREEKRRMKGGRME
jgi:hypothetical protein